MIDHMLEGRFILGIGPGGLRSDWEVFGNLDADRNAMFVECIDQILAIWAGDAPYDIEGRFWNISTRRTLLREAGQGVFLKPYQKPHPPIVITVVVPNSRGLAAAAARGWQPISANFIHPHWVATHWPTYREGCERGGHAIRGEDWRVARSIFVADDEATARRYALDPERRLRLLFLEPDDQAPRAGHARHVQARPRDVRRRMHARVRARPPADLRNARSAWPSRSSTCAGRSAPSARCSTSVTTGPTRPSPGARWSSWRPR